MGIVTGLITHTIKAAPVVALAGKAFIDKGKLERKIENTLHPKKREGYITMKKGTFAVIVTFLAAVAGALAAMFVYLRRREAELDEYEQLLFSDDFSHEEGEEDTEEDDV